MKKLLLIALSAALCLAVAMPAMAKVSVSGMLTTDYYYFDRDEQVPGVGGNGFTSTYFDMPKPLNRLTVQYANDDNSLRGYMQLRFGGRITSGGRASSTNGAAGETYINYAWIDWQLTPAAYLRFGRQTSAFAIMAPQQMVGTNTGHIVGIGWGNVHGGASWDAVRLYYKFSDAVRLELELVDPDTDNAEVVAAFPGESATAVVREENTLPRLDVALPITMGNLVLEPSVTYSVQDYDQVAGGADDSVDIYGVALGVNWGMGMFSFAGEIVYGQNLGDGAYSGGVGTASAYLDAAGNLKVEDSEVLSWWAQVGLKLGPSTLYLIYGSCNVQNDNDTASSAKTDFTRTMYGASWPISVAKGFTIRPELMWYDYDDSAELQGNPPVDQGKEMIFGIQAQLVF